MTQETTLLNNEVAVLRDDANAYCRILTLLGMEEEGDPVAQVATLLAEIERLRVGLRFYARGQHLSLDDEEDFDTVSGEPENWLCSGVENSATMVEDGGVARFTLQGKLLQWHDGGEDETPQPIDGEKAAAQGDN